MQVNVIVVPKTQILQNGKTDLNCTVIILRKVLFTSLTVLYVVLLYIYGRCALDY